MVLHKHSAIITNLLLIGRTHSLSSSQPPETTRRDLLWKIPAGTSFAYAYGNLAYEALSLQDLQYPAAHELKVAATISESFAAVEPRRGRPLAEDSQSIFRVLEVGIGKDLRLLRRNLYSEAFLKLAQRYSTVSIVGVDLELPKASTVEKTLVDINENPQPDVTLDLKQNSITSRIPFEDGYFDSIVCCLTLCSVDDQSKAIAEMKRLLRVGGTLGYVEHVAVNNDEPYKFLELQQKLLDPLQQLAADNCHLHRYTELALLDGFGMDGEQLKCERFLVEGMWPVSCQTRGIIKKIH